jgi:hypothetical protein
MAAMLLRENEKREKRPAPVFEVISCTFLNKRRTTTKTCKTM